MTVSVGTTMFIEVVAIAAEDLAAMYAGTEYYHTGDVNVDFLDDFKTQ